MIKIDMSMPKNCKECPFIDEVQAGCHASGSPGFIPFYDEKDFDKWEQLVATKRDPRCPMSEIQKEKPSGLYECFHCGARQVLWDSDFNLEDYGYEGKGVIHDCHCLNCGAEIQYIIRFDKEGEENDS